MGFVKLQISVLAKLDGRASVVISVYLCLDVNMEIVPYLWNVAVKMDGLEPIVIFVSTRKIGALRAPFARPLGMKRF